MNENTQKTMRDMTFGEILEQRPLNDIPYEAFVRGKVDYERYFGFDIDESELSPSLLPHQRDLVRWAVKGGRRALFESFGLGKTIQALEICRLILKDKVGDIWLVTDRNRLIKLTWGMGTYWVHDKSLTESSAQNLAPFTELEVKEKEQE